MFSKLLYHQKAVLGQKESVLSKTLLSFYRDYFTLQLFPFEKPAATFLPISHSYSYFSLTAIFFPAPIGRCFSLPLHSISFTKDDNFFWFYPYSLYIEERHLNFFKCLSFFLLFYFTIDCPSIIPRIIIQLHKFQGIPD